MPKSRQCFCQFAGLLLFASLKTGNVFVELLANFLFASLKVSNAFNKST